MRHPVVNNDDRYCHQVERGALTFEKTAPDPELRSGGGVASWEDADKCIVLHLTRSPATVATSEVQDLTSSAVQCVGAAEASSQGQN